MSRTGHDGTPALAKKAKYKQIYLSFLKFPYLYPLCVLCLISLGRTVVQPPVANQAGRNWTS